MTEDLQAQHIRQINTTYLSLAQLAWENPETASQSIGKMSQSTLKTFGVASYDVNMNPVVPGAVVPVESDQLQHLIEIGELILDAPHVPSQPGKLQYIVYTRVGLQELGGSRKVWQQPHGIVLDTKPEVRQIDLDDFGIEITDLSNLMDALPS